jgi:hypothetical protein
MAMKAFFAIAATAAGAFTTLTMLVFLLAASPNSSASEFRTLSFLMWGVGVVGLGCAVLADVFIDRRYRLKLILALLDHVSDIRRRSGFVLLFAGVTQ